jgi:phi13 family phage major tail protein
MTVNANAGEYKSRIGLDSLYIAEVTVDSATGYTADTPEYLAPAAEASQAPKTNAATQYADDQPYDSVVFEGETEISLTVTGIPSEMLAKLLGRQFDTVSGRVFDNPGATPPYFALSFRSLKSNGSYRYYQYLKGRFSAPTEETATKTDSPDPKTMELTYTAIPTIYNFDIGDTNEPVKRVYGDTDTDNFSATGWFTAVQTPSIAAASALALSSSDPNDGDTGVVITKTITLTFNNALPAGEIYHVVVSKADGTLVACTNSLDATKKIMTVNPDASLSASTVHIVAIGVTDIYGDTLAAVVNFTTA